MISAFTASMAFISHFLRSILSLCEDLPWKLLEREQFTMELGFLCTRNQVTGE